MGRNLAIVEQMEIAANLSKVPYRHGRNGRHRITRIPVQADCNESLTSNEANLYRLGVAAK